MFIEKPERTVVPEGLHRGLPIHIVDGGWRKNHFDQNDTRLKRQMRLTFELPDLKMPDGRPMVITSRPITQSLHDQATLAKMLKKLKIDFDKGFDPSSLIGMPCLVCVVHDKGKTGLVFAKVDSVLPITSDEPLPKPFNPTGVYDHEKLNLAFLATLPGWIQDWVSEAVDPEPRKPEASVLPDPNETLPF